MLQEKINDSKNYNSFELNENHFLNFPTSSEPDPFEKYKKGILYINSAYNSRAKSSPKGNFLTRNYKIKKSEENKKMMNEKELNSLYYKLKFYYNDILSQNKKENENINVLKVNMKKTEKKIIDFERSKEIESGNEKISNLETSNNIDKIINTINKLKQRNEEVKFNVTNENEYASTLKHLMEAQKIQLMKVNENILDIKQKLHDIKHARKILIQNIKNRNYRKNETHKINNYLEKQIEKVHEMMVEQEYKKMAIEKENKEREEKAIKLKNQYNKDLKINKYHLEQYKEETLDKISAFNFKKEEKEKKEKKVINFIVGFHFFQKYFINKNRENKNKNDLEESIDMTECKKDIDFNNFMKGEQYELCNEQEKLSDNSLENNNVIIPESIRTNKTYLKLNQGKNIKSHKKQKNHKITFEDVKQRFDELDLNYDEFYDYYTKIISRANFSRKKMINLNERLITLESQKNTYIEKVDNIILKDYKNLIDLIDNAMKYDEMQRESIIRFAKFIENNKNNLRYAEKIRNYETTKRITSIHLEDKLNPDATLIKKKNAFIDKCFNASNKIKFYYESIFLRMKELNNFRDYDLTFKNESKTSSQIIPLTIGFTNKCYEISKEKYIEDLLFYAKEKNIKFSDIIYNALIKKDKKKENMKQFLNDNLTEDNFIFYFFRQYENNEKLNKLLNSIIKYYSEKYSHLIINSNKIIVKDKISDTNLPKFSKSQYPRSSIDSLYKKDFKRGKSNKLIFLNKRENIEEINRKISLEDQINSEYNYEKTTDDSQDYNYHKVNRPKTTKLTKNKKIVQQLYVPTLEKSQYIRKLNYDLNIIKTESSRRTNTSNRYLKRTWNDIDNYENQFFVYNNPSKIIFYIFF